MPLRNLPIKRKITVVILVTCFSALTVTCAALLIYESHSYRQSTARTIETMGEIVASYSTAALSFDQRKDATEVLDGLRAERSIVAAALYDSKGRLYVSYPPERAAATFDASPRPDGMTFESRRLLYYHPATQGGSRVGTVFLEADLSDTYERLKIYGLILAGVVAASSILAYLISSVLQRQISLPLIELANTATRISEQRDISVRAKKQGSDEIGALTDAFNSMLDRIQAGRDARIAALREVEKARDAAERANRSKDDFVAALSHELRTPLNPVLLLASDAALNPELPAAVRADFETIRKNVELEARLIDDLLDLTRITRGKLTLDKRSTDVGTVLRDAITTVQAEIEEKKLHFSVSLNAPNHLVMGDPVRLQQIFWNVLRNAVKFTPVGGAVTVTTSMPAGSDRLRIDIRDTGIGLTARELETIFESFTQGEHASNPAKHRFGGMGLGLAISRMLADLHGGSITANSLGRDRGATFTIELPLLAAHLERPSERKPDSASPATAGGAGKSAGGRRILLVDDHEPTRTALAQLLHARKYHVKSAGSLEEARQVAAAETFDLLVSDIGLPDGNGYELMAELHAKYGLKGVALSGYGMEQDITRSREAGFVSHLIKPVTVKALEKALAAARPAATLNA